MYTSSLSHQEKEWTQDEFHESTSSFAPSRYMPSMFILLYQLHQSLLSSKGKLTYVSNTS